MNHVAVILPAAGRSVRYGGPRNKLLEPLAGMPVIAKPWKPNGTAEMSTEESLETKQEAR